MRCLRLARLLLPALLVLAATGTSARAQSCPDPGLQYLLDMANGRQGLSSLQFMAQPNWQTFMHPASPLLSFTYPPGWQAQPLQQMSAVGVLLRSPDAVAALQIYATPPSGQITSQQAAQMSLASLLGQGAQMRMLCGRDFQVPGVYSNAVSFMGVTDGRSIAATVTSVTYDTSGAAVWIDMRSVAAPAQQFASYLQQVFLPVFAQLQMGGGGYVGGGGYDDGGDDDGGVDDGGVDDGGGDVGTPNDGGFDGGGLDDGG